MLGPVVVPGHAVVIEEGEQFRADLLEPLLACQREFGRKGAASTPENAQLASGEPTLLAFTPIGIPELRQQFIDYHELVLKSSMGTVRRYRATSP
jgi:hypothetical protein